MIYKEEIVTLEILQEMTPMLVDHWNEVAVNKDKVSLDLDYDGYLKLYEAGVLKLFTVRKDLDNKLIGYHATMLTPHFHYKSTLFAMNDVIYVSPEYRGKTVGYRLIKFAEESLKRLGVDVVSLHIKVEHNFSPMVEKLGYRVTEKICTKYIGD